MVANKVSFACSQMVSFTRKQKKHDFNNDNVTILPLTGADTFNGKEYKIQEPVAPKDSIADKAFSFVKRSKHKQKDTAPVVINVGDHGLSTEYRNILKKNLVATPNPNLRLELSKTRNIYDLNKAELRISSLSRYLKEDMVGFIIPSGHQWFDGSLENFIHGAKAKRVPENQFKSTAKEFWSLIAKADPYWTSNEFINYLGTVKDTPARNATIEAIKEIKKEREAKGSQINFTGYETALKDIKKLLKDGCAYTGVPMVRHSNDQHQQVSAEHIFPHSRGGRNSDFNYLLAASRPNSDRGSLPLIDFLKGKDA
ncbi:MAG: hypothetical protein AB7V50_07660 [Vampirovibrionia bacterium]